MTTRAISLFFAVASAAAYAFTHVESAACYASRYPELHERFCLNDICDTRALHDHFKNEGRTKKWRCYGYEKVPVGGIVIFDDVFSHPPVMSAWVDFKSDQGLPETLNRIDLCRNQPVRRVHPTILH